METTKTDEMESLLQKYAGGRIPPLIADPTELGLINGELFKIYQRGFSGTRSIPLGILIASENYSSVKEKWEKGNYGFNQWVKDYWVSFCKSVRSEPVGEEICDACDRRQAAIAEREGRVIAYLCDGGMIDFATPVFVEDRIIVVIFTGQRKPKGGPIWNREIIQCDGLFRPLAPEEKGIDVWAESKERIRAIAKKLKIEDHNLLDKVEKCPEIEVSPEDIARTTMELKIAGKQLSDLATNTFKLEKSNIVGWIRTTITEALVPISAVSPSVAEVWRKLPTSLRYFCTYMGLDYVLILSCGDESKESVALLCQYGLPEGSFPSTEYLCAGREEALSKLISGIRQWTGITQIELSEYETLPIFDQLRHLHEQNGSNRVLAIPIVPMGTPSTVILGRYGEGLSMDAFSEHDKDGLRSIIDALVLATGITLLIEQLQETTEKQAVFVEDVAHNIRNPIQNVIVKTSLLRQIYSPAERDRQLRRLAAQVRRLHLLSKRVWTLENIRREGLDLDEDQVNIYEVLMECRRALIDLAENRTIEISVAERFTKWPSILVDRDLFMEAVLNLLDNAIKYSSKETEIKVAGERSDKGVCLSFQNSGIQLQEKDKERIFERYFRTREGEAYAGAGTGIGLCIVKAFADHYGSIDVKSVPIEGTWDYLTEFSLFIRQGSD